MLPWLKKPFRLEDLKRSLTAPRCKTTIGASEDQLPANILEWAIASGSLTFRYQAIFDLETMSPAGVAAVT